MPEFKPIETQEDFNERIKERLERERAKAVKEAAEKYANYDEYKQKAADFDKKESAWADQIKAKDETIKAKDDEIASLTANVKVAKMEATKMRVATENGIPLQLADRLSGDDEEAIAADAQKMAQYIKKTNAAPFGAAEGTPNPNESAAAAALRTMAHNLGN